MVLSLLTHLNVCDTDMYSIYISVRSFAGIRKICWNLWNRSLALRRMDPSYSEVEGEVYPLYSGRLKLKHFQQLASALGLPKAATKSDIEVMITGKLTEMSHNPRSVQVVVSQTE